MTDLYETLGVPRDADKAAIQRAYRRAAKGAHPDTGGSRDQFGALTLAYATLRDDQRRAHYDRTGQTSTPGADNAQAEILSIVAQALEAATAQALEMNAQNPLACNLLEIARSRLRVELQTTQKIAREKRKHALLARRAASKFIRKNGPNQVSAIFSAKADSFEASAVSAENAASRGQSALNLLKDYSFTPDVTEHAGEVSDAVMATAFTFAGFDQPRRRK